MYGAIGRAGNARAEGESGPLLMAVWAAMTAPVLLDSARNVFSQNGEDGVIDRIFEVVPPTSRTCCEFGAWDGIHLSNTRNLLRHGWGGIQIEGDSVRFKELVATYAGRPDVVCVNRFVASDGPDSLRSIVTAAETGAQLDLLSIDIDGDDFYIFSSLGEWPAPERPRLVVVEISAGHSPEAGEAVPRALAAENIGQPIRLFCDQADRLGYRLIAYTGNGFFLRNDAGGTEELPTLTPEIAYDQCLARLDQASREWLYRANLGQVDPYHRFGNPYLSASKLGISRSKRLYLGACDTRVLPHRLRARRRRAAHAAATGAEVTQ
jgi:hypothetical protein